jgi:hypothetical protein
MVVVGVGATSEGFITGGTFVIWHDVAPLVNQLALCASCNLDRQVAVHVLFTVRVVIFDRA